MRILDILRKPMVGIDIGTSGIKAVEVLQRRRPHVLTYNRVPLPWGTISQEGEIQKKDIVKNAIQSLFTQGAFTSRNIILGGSGNSVILKKITVPRMTQDEIANELYWEAEQYVSFPIDEVNLDFVILGKSDGDRYGSPTMDVLLVAAKKSYIRELSSVIEGTRLNLIAVSTHAFAVGNVLEALQPQRVKGTYQGTHLIVDLGAATTKLTAIVGNNIVYHRTLKYGGSSISEKLAHHLGVSIEEAEVLKIANPSDPEVRPILKDSASEIAQEISRAIDLYISQTQHRSILAIFSCGGMSRDPYLSSEIHHNTGIPVSPLATSIHTGIPGGKQHKKITADFLTVGPVALGLGMRI